MFYRVLLSNNLRKEFDWRFAYSSYKSRDIHKDFLKSSTLLKIGLDALS